MQEQIPDWLKNTQKEDAFIPDREFVENLEPQSRLEALLKKEVLGD